MPKCLVIEADGKTYEKELSTSEDFQQLIPGYWQWVSFGDGCGAICDEDGKARGLPYNAKATRWGNRRKIGWLPGDYFAGTIVLVGPANDAGDYEDFPAELAQQILADTLQRQLYFPGPC